MTISPNGRKSWKLESDEVHVWNADLDRVAFDDVPCLLSSDEWQRAARIHEPISRRRFIAGRSLLRTILGGYSGIEPREIVFTYESFGKPRLVASGHRGPIFFNLAHSEQVALFAVTGAGAVGVDVERIRAIPEAEDIAAAYFPDIERACLRSLPEAQRASAFMRFWTRLEAGLKALGWGWIGPGIRLEPPEVPALSMYEVEAAPGYAASLALTRPGCRIVQRIWDEGVREAPERLSRTG